jgi:hypothetical protein
MEIISETSSEIGELTRLTDQLAIAGEWYEDEKRDFPPIFTKGTLKLFPEIRVNDNGEKTYYWDGSEKGYTEVEWEEKWTSQFPNIKRADGSTPQETLLFRTQQTTNKKIIENAWADLGKTSIPYPHHWSNKVKGFMDKFKCDMYGNVISIEADNNALTKFDIDHIFPWSRGGRSRRPNFAAVQCVANRAVKNDTILQLLDPAEMKCGIQVEQFVNFIDFTITQAAAIGKGRSNLQAELSQIESWLLHTPYKGMSWSNFQKMVQGTTSGRELYRFFMKRHIDLLNAHLCLLDPIEGKIADVNITAKDADTPPSEPTRLPESLKEFSLPCINLLVTPSSRIECYNSYAIHNELRDSLQMNWDGKRKCWWKKYNEDLSPFIEAIKTMAKNQDCDIKITTAAPTTPVKTAGGAATGENVGHKKDGTECKKCAKSPTHFCEQHKDQRK